MLDIDTKLIDSVTTNDIIPLFHLEILMLEFTSNHII
jgi:hypothetical protein